MVSPHPRWSYIDGWVFVVLMFRGRRESERGRLTRPEAERLSARSEDASANLERVRDGVVMMWWGDV